MSDLYKNLVTQVVLYILRLRVFNFVFAQKPICIPLAWHFQVFGLLIQKLHVFQVKSILLELSPFILANHFFVCINWQILVQNPNLVALFQRQHYRQYYFISPFSRWDIFILIIFSYLNLLIHLTTLSTNGVMVIHLTTLSTILLLIKKGN